MCLFFYCNVKKIIISDIAVLIGRFGNECHKRWMLLTYFLMGFVSPYRAPVSYSIQLKAISLVFYFNHPQLLVVNTTYKYIYTFDFIIPHFRLGRIQFLWILSLSTFYYILHWFTRSLGKLTMLWNLPSTTPHRYIHMQQPIHILHATMSLAHFHTPFCSVLHYFCI